MKFISIIWNSPNHKRVLEGDKGKNTGGMGAYSPSRLENEKLNKKDNRQNNQANFKGFKRSQYVYLGFLYMV